MLRERKVNEGGEEENGGKEGGLGALEDRSHLWYLGQSAEALP